MPCYRFRLIILGQLLDEERWLELADGDAALAKARCLAEAFLRFADGTVPWRDGVLVVDRGDGSASVNVPIVDAAGEASICRH